MSRITQKSAVAPIGMFQQATSSTGTGFVDASFVTYTGQKFDTSDGRELALVSVGATAIASGVLVQSPAEVTAFEKLAMTVPTATPATAGTFQVLVTNGSTVLNVNQFQGGYLIVASGTGIGQTLKISTHQAAANGATFIVNVEDAIVTTLDATSKISLIYNPYGNNYTGVIITPASTATGVCVGATFYPLAASTAQSYNATTGLVSATTTGVQQWGLIVCKGPAGILVDSTVTNVGYPIGVSKTTAGTVGVASLTTVPQIGQSMQTLTSANTGMIYLQL